MSYEQNLRSDNLFFTAIIDTTAVPVLQQQYVHTAERLAVTFGGGGRRITTDTERSIAAMSHHITYMYHMYGTTINPIIQHVV